MSWPGKRAPDALVRQVAALTMPPLNPRGGSREQQYAQHLATIRRYLDQAYAEGFVNGAAYRASLEPARVVVPLEHLDAVEEMLERARERGQAPPS